jgi:hypothetical protein
MEKLRETSGSYSSLIRKIHPITSIRLRQVYKKKLKAVTKYASPKRKTQGKR